MRELSVARQAGRIIQAGINSVKSSRDAKIRLECIEWNPHYCEPGYDTPSAGIYFGNWNNPSRYDKESGTCKPVCDTVERVARRLESIGVELEWSDEWTQCDDCGGAVRTEPDCYWWIPSYVIRDGCEIVCKGCQREDETEDPGDNSDEDAEDDSNDWPIPETDSHANRYG